MFAAFLNCSLVAEDLPRFIGHGRFTVTVGCFFKSATITSYTHTASIASGQDGAVRRVGPVPTSRRGNDRYCLTRTIKYITQFASIYDNDITVSTLRPDYRGACITCTLAYMPSQQID